MSRATTAERRHAPLADDILSSGHLRTKSAKRKSRPDEDEGDQYLDSKTSRKILQIGQDLADEDAEESRIALAAAGVKRNTAFDFESRFGAEGDDGEGNEDAEKYGEDEWGDVEEEIEEVEVDPNDLDTFHKFVPRGEEDPIFNPRSPDDEEQGQSTNLADLILEKIAAYEAEKSGSQPQIIGGGTMEDAVELPAKAVEVYQRVGFLLSRYKSGPLPKPFQNPPHPPPMANPPRNHAARKVDAKHHLRRHPHLHLRQTAHRPGIHQHRPPRPRPRRHPRNQKTARAHLQRAEKGPLQTRLLLQGLPLPPRAVGHLHPARSTHRLQRDHPRLDPRAPLRRRPAAPVRHGGREDGVRPLVRGHGRAEHVHPRVPGEEIRAALQSHRCACVSLPAVPGHGAGAPAAAARAGAGGRYRHDRRRARGRSEEL
ncbi:bystin [Blastomyces dermatitidis ER-3]|uniref:Bystin n=1 Tax=Ajellomyces dermatitidis (strain ER-3 / ATCC MYA-2586) TaxID=559297 RepID=A0ABP2ER45_AJEDR|nr:bystin [Blastomyces dermatitidis ER-3]EEQ86126.2 bystin [Blastomyces dermatitidis ER-3]